MYLNPSVKQRQGLLYNREMLNETEFLLDIEFAIGNFEKSVFGTNGMGIFLLQEVLSKDVDKGILFGYSADFIGAGVFLNTGLRKRDTQSNQRVEGIQGAVSDGSKTVSTWDIPVENACYFHYRENPGEDGKPIFNKLRLQYSDKKLNVLFFEKESEEFKKCLSLDVDLSAGSYLAFSASSGVWDEDYHIIRQIRTSNPNKIDKSHHTEDAKKLKGQKYVESLRMSADFIHDNRMKYKDKDDLITKVNQEITTFLMNTHLLEQLVRDELTQSTKDRVGSATKAVDFKKLNDDFLNIMKDVTMLK